MTETILEYWDATLNFIQPVLEPAFLIGTVKAAFALVESKLG